MCVRAGVGVRAYVCVDVVHPHARVCVGGLYVCVCVTNLLQSRKIF